jgi:heme/copper-type cytochrome/quinol oxidase subunit 2
MRLTIAAAAAVLALAACNGSNDPSTIDTTSPPATTPASAGPPSPRITAASCPAAPAPPAGATIVTATVVNGKVTTEHGEWSVKAGTPVRVAVNADVKDEVHVHTFDKKQDTTPGCPTSIDFTANIPGTHEVELEEAGLELFTLKVTP